MSPVVALNGGVLRRSKSSVIESAVDDPPASSVPPPLTLNRHKQVHFAAVHGAPSSSNDVVD